MVFLLRSGRLDVKSSLRNRKQGSVRLAEVESDSGDGQHERRDMVRVSRIMVARTTAFVSEIR